MAIKTRVWTVGKLMLLVAALVATYVLFAVATMRVAFRAREVQLPDLTGREVSQATSILGSVGLTVRVDDNKRFDPKVQAGRIVGQEPTAGEPVRRGRSVKVWLSRGARVSVAPRLIGDSEQSAERRIAEEGLIIREVAEIRTDQYQADTVISQDPPPGMPGDAVALLVSRGERASGYVMPDLIGITGDAAIEALRSHGLRATVVAQQPYPGVPSGIVLRQHPTAGYQVTAEQAVSLEVSR